MRARAVQPMDAESVHRRLRKARTSFVVAVFRSTIARLAEIGWE
jgi:hypothetical protein